MEKTRAAILGTGFISNIHLESYQRFVHDAEIAAIYGRDLEHAKKKAEEFGIPSAFDDLDKLFESCEIDVVDICLPNYLHYDACMKAFAPKYERVRSLVEAGAVGDVYLLKQAEKHSGPHSRWFYQKETAGGGVMMDMGCHALAWFRWMNKGVKVKFVFADMKTVLHKDITDCDDNTITLVEFENEVTGMAEDSWARHGGMDDRIEVYGTKGVSYAYLFQGSSALTYSTEGYDYAAEKAGSTQGWSFTMYEEAFNQGYPQELTHFIDCVRNDKEPLVTGQDGRDVLEIIYAAYESARLGQKAALPFSAKVDYPIQLLLGKE